MIDREAMTEGQREAPNHEDGHVGLTAGPIQDLPPDSELSAVACVVPAAAADRADVMMRRHVRPLIAAVEVALITTGWRLSPAGIAAVASVPRLGCTIPMSSISPMISN